MMFPVKKNKKMRTPNMPPGHAGKKEGGEPRDTGTQKVNGELGAGGEKRVEVR